MNTNIIEKIEEQTGQRYDSNDGDNDTMTTLYGMLAIALSGNDVYKESDAFPVGVYLKHQMSPEGNAEREAGRHLKNLILSGLSPDMIHKLNI
jgi:hypothetical protein